MKQKASYKIPLDSLIPLAGQNREKKEGVWVVKAAGEKAGSELAAQLLYAAANAQTVLFLAGGNTPANLYSALASKRILKIGAAGMVDERFGPPAHGLSNELKIAKSGLTGYFDGANIPFYPILAEEENIAQTASRYDAKVRSLLSHFARSIAILGIGEDGHIAGIAPNRRGFVNPLFSAERADLLVDYFKHPKAMSPEGLSTPPFGFGERVTMTIRGLSEMDLLLVLAFGRKKKGAITNLFREGLIEQVPSRFLKRPEVAGKTILITDQIV